MTANNAAKRGAEKARYAQRRARAQADESKPEGDAVGTVEDTEQQLAADVEHSGKSLLRHASAASRKKREAARLSEEKESGSEENSAQGQSGADQEAPQASNGEKQETRQEATKSHSEDMDTPGHETAHSRTGENQQISETLRNNAEKPTDLKVSDSTEVLTPSQPDIAAKKRKPSQLTPDVQSPGAQSSDAPAADSVEPRRARQNHSRLKRKDNITSERADGTATGSADAQPQGQPASTPRSRMLSADELESARERKFGRIGTEEPPPAEAALTTPVQEVAVEGLPPPRTRQQKTDLYHERPAPLLPREKETLHEPVIGSRVIESAPRVEIKTADVGAKAAGRTANTAAEAAKEKVADEASKRVANHMKELSRKAAEKSAKALKASAKSALRAVQAAGKALVNAITAGGGVVVVIIMVILMCASILSSPFGIFTHSDGIEDPNSYTLTKAISDINAEYVSEVKSKAKGADNVSILIEGNLEGDIEPVNWVDVLGVFAVHVTMREDNAMNVVDLSEAQLKELRTVF